MPKSKKPKFRSVGKKNITLEENQKDKVVALPPRDFAFFFVGGAADKKSYYGMSPTNLIQDARTALIDRLKSKGYDSEEIRQNSYHLGYDDAKGDEDIKVNFIERLQDTSSLVYLIGHSLGGWNSAHLSAILTDKGYSVEYLVTLDPVGEGIGVAMLSDIYWSKPSPKYKDSNWINIRAEVPEKLMSADDTIADLGGQWNVTTGPSINETVSLHHGNAEGMFTIHLKGGKSALDILVENFQGYVKPKPPSGLPEIKIED
ncbi:alpha/beta hydrolase [Jeongeupia chitinilytica]|uniref:Alpha/beta hydrolase n=1 Tax=Jeongeupia chitinilytica TaxID=1041641 RepID=A0ABQ3H1K2_9NEIS|nr:alpha/beta hydrolase [Jeongeupia chitinilytica]GHD62645.1 hypothetical protein GCM10007350_18990 [Jeongeupia chitinilytica]